MKMRNLAAVLGLMTMTAGAANAATIGFTEGTRDQVAGTTLVSGTDASNSASGFTLTDDLGGAVSEVLLHGRIVGSNDYFNFEAKTDFQISFIFGGYDVIKLDAANDPTESGFVRENPNSAGNQSEFVLAIGGSEESFFFQTDITGGVALIFAGGPGNYTLSIENEFVDPSKAALYDLRIASVPLPAGALLLLSGLGALAWGRRRKSV